MPRSSWIPAFLRTANRAALRSAFRTDLRVENLEHRWVPTGLDAIDDTAVVARDSGPTTIDVVQNDERGVGETTIVGASQGSGGGKVTITVGRIEYTPDPGYFGTETFTYTIEDADTLQTDTATVTVTVTPGNTPPTASDVTDSVAEDAWVTTDLGPAAADADGDGLAVVAYGQGGHGTVTVTGWLATYTPAPNYVGTDSYTYTVDDGSGTTATGTVTITVTAGNDAPGGAADAYSIAGDAPLVVAAPGALGNDVDIDGDPLSAVLETGPAHGSLVLNSDGSFTYTPAAGYAGTDGFTYRPYDGLAFGAPATVGITVTGVNGAPVLSGPAGPVSHAENTAANIPVAAYAATDANAGDTLTFSLTGADAARFELVQGSGNVVELRFRSAPDFETPTDADANGSYEVSVVVSDGVLTDERAVSVGVFNLNEGLTLGGPTGVVVSENAFAVASYTTTDPDNGATPTYTLEGTDSVWFAIDAAGNLAFRDAPDYELDSTVYTVTVRATDAQGESVVVVVTVAVANANDNTPAFSGGTSPTVTEGTAAVTVGAATDADGDVVAYAIVGGADQAQFEIDAATGALSFLAAPDFETPGSAGGSNTYEVLVGASDGSTTVNRLYTVTIANANDTAPAATPDVLVVGEDGGPVGVAVLSNDTDADNATGLPNAGLTVATVTQPAHGTVTLVGGVVSYAPAANFFGTDSFTYTVGDGVATTTGTVTVTVSPVNDAPVHTAGLVGALSVAEDAQATTLGLSGVAYTSGPANEAGETLTIRVTVVPGAGLGLIVLSNGTTAAVAGGTYTLSELRGMQFRPAANATGTGTFTYTVTDDGFTGGASDPKTLTESLVVIVGAVNDPPVALGASLSTAEDATLTGTVGGSDAEGSALTAVLASSPTHGTLVLTAAGAFTYTPAPNYHGPDSFEFRLYDGNAFGTAATVAITVTAVNDAPVAADDAATVAEDGVVAVPVRGNDADADGDSLTVIAVTQGVHGAVTSDGTGVTYTPAANFHGTDSFTYTVADGHGGTATATVGVIVTAVNDAPTTADASATTPEDTAVGGTMVGSDVDNDGLAYAVVSGPDHGKLTSFDASTGAYTYAPTANFHGTDAIAYLASDGHGGTAAATVTFTVSAVNDAPTAAAGAYGTAEDTPLTVGSPGVLAGAADADGDALSAVLVSGPTHGTLVLNANGSFAYTPAAGYHGPDSFTVRVSDGHGGTADAVVAVAVTPADSAPPVPAASAPASGPAPVVVMPVGGGSTTVRVMNPDGSVRFAIDPFPGFGGRVGLATADVTGDGVADIVAGAGAGGGPVVKVFDGATGAELLSFAAYDPSFRGGVHVAAADLTGDGVPDIVAGAGDGGAPHVKVFDGRTGAELRSFFAFDSSYRGGVNVATGDVTGDGRADVVAAVAGDGAPHVKVFDGATGAEMMSFFAFPVGFTGGVRVAVGDLDGDGAAEVVVGAGPGGGPVVAVYSGRTGVERARFMTFDSSTTGGLDVAVHDIGGHPKVVVSAGSSGAVYDGLTLALEDEFVVGGPAV